jgi:hypothetical protein
MWWKVEPLTRVGLFGAAQQRAPAEANSRAGQNKPAKPGLRGLPEPRGQSLAGVEILPVQPQEPT